MSKVKNTFFGGDEKRAARKAAEGQRAAGQEIRKAEELGVEAQRQQLATTEGRISPFTEAGTAALAEQQALLGLSGQEAQQAAFSGIQESAGQQFLRKRQEKAILRHASATGGLDGGNVLNQLQENAFGLAQTEIQNQFGRLGQLAGRGQDAAVNLGQFGGTAASNIQAGLSRAGGGVAQGVAGSAATKAQGILGQGAALRGGIQQVAGGIAGGLSGGLAAGVAGPPISGGQQFSNAVQGFFGV